MSSEVTTIEIDSHASGQPAMLEFQRADCNSQDAQYLFHLALRCASTPSGTRADNVQLLLDGPVSKASLWDSVRTVGRHLDAHPDDDRLQQAHELLVLAYCTSAEEVA